ncbi:hypothetical protein GALMADRAFT_273266 [Galerina marginata CBS 339.88]|uniref:ZIP zinc/iron transport family n=1 Tax=Galerina marginata (strain CBS 339.88) TaxID=685588 RepID=A0A067SKJ6_GALM3|nr:hypothetical protein GALMADRAFT_273266 [Galerina marginata CBS 339.88]
MDSLNCGNGGGADTFESLRIASVFVVAIGSFAGALFPVYAVRSKWLHVPPPVFDFAKYFGSGVIIATAFIHLLSPAIEELTSPCLDPSWLLYPYPLAFCLLSIFSIFTMELIAYRWGTAKMKKLGMVYDTHGHNVGGYVAHGPEHFHAEEVPQEDRKASRDVESPGSDGVSSADALSQMVSIAILEFGILLHSVLIGLTLAVQPDFKIVFIVIIFHQTFEGLGVGSRLAQLKLAKQYQWLQVLGGVLYGITTPLGIAVGLGVKSTYNPNSTRASIVSGVLDSLSAGILIYTGVVELLAHEFLFNKQMVHWSNGKLAYAVTCVVSGAGIMALLANWV